MISKKITNIDVATPSAGTSTPVDKLNPNGEGEVFEYRFSQSNPVGQAKIQKGATLKAVATQAGKDWDNLTQANCE